MAISQELAGLAVRLAAVLTEPTTVVLKQSCRDTGNLLCQHLNEMVVSTAPASAQLCLLTVPHEAFSSLPPTAAAVAYEAEQHNDDENNHHNQCNADSIDVMPSNDEA